MEGPSERSGEGAIMAASEAHRLTEPLPQEISASSTSESGDLHAGGVPRRLLPPLEIGEEQTGDPAGDPVIAEAAKPPEVSDVPLQRDNSVAPDDVMEQIRPEDSMDQLRPSTPSTDDKMVDLDPPINRELPPDGHVESWLQGTAAAGQNTSWEAVDASNFLKNISPKNAKSVISRNVLKRSEAVADIDGQAQVARDTSFIRLRNVKTALHSRSLYMFPPDSKFRLLCYGMISSPYFELAVMFVILANCLALALYIPNKPDHILTKISQYGEYAVTGLFTLEFLIKITALGGFLHQGAYLGYWPDGIVDWWNVMDLVVILLGFVSLIPGSNNFQALRTLRLLRPLASISTSSSMRVLIKALYGSLAQLVDVLLLCSFLYVMYGIIGVQIWMGTFRNHCVHDVTGDVLDVDVVCGVCPDSYTCRDTLLDNVTALPNPNDGVNSFDHFGYASVVVFQTLFSEGWVQIEGYTLAISGTWARIYWVSLIVLGCFFVVNLAIGVVFASFTRVTELERRDQLRRKKSKEADPTATEAEVAGDVHFLARRNWRKTGKVLQLTVANGENGSQANGDHGAAEACNIPLIGEEQSWESDAAGGDDEGMIHPLPREIDSKPAVPPVNLPINMPGLVADDGHPASHRTPRTARDVVIHVPQAPPSALAGVTEAGPVAESCRCHEGSIGSLGRSMHALTSPAWLSRGFLQQADRLPWCSAPGPLAEATEKDTEEDTEADWGNDGLTYPCCCCCAPGEDLRSRLYSVAVSAELQALIALCIIANTVTLSLNHYPMEDSFSQALQTCNTVFLATFTTEALVKILGLGKGYFRDSFNMFDLSIVVVSWVEILIDSMADVEFPGLTVLRATRLLRILRVINQWQGLSNLAVVILKGISNLMSFIVILFIFIFTFALMGMQIFSGRMCAEYACTDPSVTSSEECVGIFYDEASGTEGRRYWECLVYHAEPASYNYDNAWQAFLCTFQIFTGENWHMIMYAAVRGTNMASCLYFITVVVFGHYLLLNLFLAGIVRNVVDQHAMQKQKARATSMSRRHGRQPSARRRSSMSQLLVKAIGSSFRKISSSARSASGSDSDSGPTTQKFMTLPSLHHKLIDFDEGRSKLAAENDEIRANASKPTPRKRASVGLIEPTMMPDGLSAFTDNNDDNEEPESRAFRRLMSAWPRLSLTSSRRQASSSRQASSIGLDELEGIPRPSRENHSLYIFAPNNRFRQWCYGLVSHTYFEMAIVVLIILSTILLAMQNPHRPYEGTFGQVLNMLDIFFTGLFLLEALLKIVAFGMLWPEEGPMGKAYLRESWNVLDFTIVVLSLVSLVAQSKLRAFKTLRTTRAIRPLRILSKSDGMKQVLRSLSRVVAESASIFVCLLLAWLVFAVLGVELFSGKFHCCSDPSRMYQEGMAAKWGGDPALECTGNFTDPESGKQVPREWQGSLPNFDNTGQALLTLFEITTLEDWDGVMQQGIDARGIGICPKRNANPINAIYFLAFVIFGALYMFNLVVSAVINEYIRSKDYGGFDAGALSFGEIEWVDTVKTWLSTRPEKLYRMPRNAHPFRKWLFMIVHHQNMEIFIMGCVLANTVLMMCDHWGAPESYWTITEYINYAFSGIYICEAALKIVGMGYSEYFGDRWNHLDFAIVIISIITTAVTEIGHSVYIQPSLIRIFRMFRAARILRAARRAKGMRMLIRTLKLSLPSLWHVGSVLFLIFVVFSILGMYLLGDADRGGMINDEINFETFGNSLWVLFFSLTGENWPTLLHNFMDQGKWEAIPFFLMFISIAFFILLNLFLAVILDRFTETKRMEEYKLSPADFAGFSKAWAEHDPHATLVIPAVKLEGLIERLPKPLGIQGMGFSKVERLRMLQSLNLQGYGSENVVHYHEVLFALSYRVAGSPLPDDAEAVLVNLCARAFPNLLKLPKERISYSHTSSATRIQALVRGHQARKRFRVALQAAVANETIRKRSVDEARRTSEDEARNLIQ